MRKEQMPKTYCAVLPKKSAAEKIRNADIIYFLGGLPDRMMDRIKEFELIDVLTQHNDSIRRVITERRKTVYATALQFGAILVDNGKMKLLGDVKNFDSY